MRVTTEGTQGHCIVIRLTVTEANDLGKILDDYPTDLSELIRDEVAALVEDPSWEDELES